jgi:ABC-2 type transport system permease protein
VADPRLGATAGPPTGPSNDPSANPSANVSANSGTGPSAFGAYRAVLASRLRAQLQYPVSFGFDLVQSALTFLVGLVEVAGVFHNVPVLADLDLRAGLLVYGLAASGFGLANAIAGQLDTIPTYIRTGTLETMLVRPQPVLAQILTSDVTLRRIGSGVIGTATLAVVLPLNHIAWTPAKVALLVVTPLAAGLLFSALFLVAGALQFWLVDAAEVTSAFVYGGNYAAGYSAGVFPLPLRLLVVFAVPVSFAAYLPAAAILGLPGPPGAPGWLGWAAPAVALVVWFAAMRLWALGLRHYTGAGG